MKIHTLFVIGFVAWFGLVPTVYAQEEEAFDDDMNAVDIESSVESAPRETIVKPKVSFSWGSNQRDPMLSSDDMLLIKYREQQRLAAEAAERQRQAEAERRRLAEEERRRLQELALIKDPTMIIRNQIRISGLIDKEVLIGGKLYTIGHTYKGARIVAVGPDSVTFSYKGHKFVKKVDL